MQTLVQPPPIFIKANFTFKVLDREHSFINQPVSVYGVSGLRWEHFDPLDRVGERVTAKLDILARERFSFNTSALLTAEVTNDASYLGMKFYMNEFERTRLAETIKREGFYPTNYMRKYPRIPALDIIYSMPLRAIARHGDGDLIVFDIANISPNGILLKTENPKASFYMPGSRISVQVEPRGDVFQSFEFEGVICRVVMDKNPETKALSRMLGIRVMRIENDQKAVFLEVLRAVIANIQDTGLIK